MKQNIILFLYFIVCIVLFYVLFQPSNKSDVDPDLNLEDELLEAREARSSGLHGGHGHSVSSKASAHTTEDQITKAEADKVEVEERLEEMEKVVVSLQVRRLNK